MLGPSTFKGLQLLGKRLSIQTSADRERSFLFQRLLLAVVCGTAAVVMATGNNDRFSQNLVN